MKFVKRADGDYLEIPTPRHSHLPISNMRTLWFTFGQVHVHSVNGRTFDKDTVVKITAQDPRRVMVEHFGMKWGHEYDTEPDMKHFSEIVEL